MHSTTFFVALASVASAAMHDVAVGAGGKLVYDPATVMAAEGDIIRFNWPSSIGHNVVSSDYDSPCQPNGNIASPIMMSDSMDFFVMVNSTDPMFFYCSVGSHCNLGMVMAVNPSSDDTLDTYSSGAMSASIMQPPSSTPIGGILAAPSATPFAAAGGSGSAMSSSAASMSSGSSMSSARATSTATQTTVATETATASAMTMTGAGNPAATAAPMLAGALGVLAFAL